MIYLKGNNAELKALLEALDSSRMFTICHLLTSQYISEWQETLNDTELRNIVLQVCMVKGRSIIC
jgi:hypothetical protein